MLVLFNHDDCNTIKQEFHNIMNIDLAGKTAIVCGSSQGMGKAVAFQFAESGANVILLARNEEVLRQVRSDLPRNEIQHHDYLVVDFSNPEILKNKIKKLILEKAPINILVNNDGTPPAGPILETNVETIMKEFTSSLICFHILVQAVAPGMKKENYGRIINITTSTVLIPGSIPILSMNASAIASWSKSMANELTPFGITVNNLMPGTTQTNAVINQYKQLGEKEGVPYEALMDAWKATIPANRFAEPEEIAYAITFLASPQAGYISGTSLLVDGGRIKALS
jgi:3-oxoacyl-[acyl-carrier protein] reductase